MDRIIHPGWIYLMGLIAPLHVLLKVGMIVVILIGIVMICATIDAKLKGEEIGEIKKLKGVGIKTLVFFVILAILFVFIPSKDTLTKMIIFNNLTYNKVDTIISKTGSLKETLKQDVIDILNYKKDKE